MVMKYLQLPVSLTFDYDSTTHKFNNVECVCMSGDSRIICAHIVTQCVHQHKLDVVIMSRLGIHSDSGTKHVVMACVTAIVEKSTLHKTKNKMHTELCATVKTHTNITLCGSTFTDKHEQEMKIVNDKLKRYRTCIETLIARSDEFDKLEIMAENEHKLRKQANPVTVRNSMVSSSREKITNFPVPCSNIWMRHVTSFPRKEENNKKRKVDSSMQSLIDAAEQTLTNDVDEEDENEKKKIRWIPITELQDGSSA